MKRGFQAWGVVLPALVLTVAVVLQGMPMLRPIPAPLVGQLKREIPVHVDGWIGREVPLGPSEFIAGEVEKVLRYDEVVNREFVRGGERFGVYVAYWGAGKMPSQLVASHTPDRCWTENGWRCLDMKFRQQVAVDGAPLLPAEWRQFVPPVGEEPTYVLFWHLNNGELYDYGERFNAVPDPVRWWKDVLRQAVQGNGEQYFVRVTSSQPLEELWSDPGFTEVMRGLGRLGLTADNPAATRL